MAKSKKITPAARITPAAKMTPAPHQTAVSQNPEPKTSGIQKDFLNNRPVCRVTFTLPGAAAPDAQSVCVVGEFNNWSHDANPMTRRKNDGFSVSLELEKGRSYRFRYLIDGCKFENDWAADRYEPNPYGSEDSVIDL